MTPSYMGHSEVRVYITFSYTEVYTVRDRLRASGFIVADVGTGGGGG